MNTLLKRLQVANEEAMSLKEQCVAKQDFAMASNLRDVSDLLKKTMKLLVPVEPVRIEVVMTDHDENWQVKGGYKV